LDAKRIIEEGGLIGDRAKSAPGCASNRGEAPSYERGKNKGAVEVGELENGGRENEAESKNASW